MIIIVLLYYVVYIYIYIVLQLRADELLYSRRLRHQLALAQELHSNGCRLGIDDQKMRGFLCNVRKLARQCEQLEVLTVERKHIIAENLTDLIAEIHELLESLQYSEQKKQMEVLNNVVEELRDYKEVLQPTPEIGENNMDDMIGMFDHQQVVPAPDDKSTMLDSHIKSRDEHTYYSHDTVER